MLRTSSCALQRETEVKEQERELEEGSRETAMSRNPGRSISGRGSSV